MLETAKGPVLQNLVEQVKEILENSFKKILENYGIQEDSSELIPLDDLVNYILLNTHEEQIKFIDKRENLHEAILEEMNNFKMKWNEAFTWYLDKIVYSFFNRIFAIRIMEELDLLNESTLIPQEDLGHRSARMAKIQEKYPHDEDKWWEYLLRDVFNELDQEIKVIFDPNDPVLSIFPDNKTIIKIVELLNKINPEIYKAEDCIGWFYHYYVLKFRQNYKTMSGHGEKSPANSYMLSILNTVYTPRWMVQILVDNSLGHWWLNHYKDSKQFLDSPYFIKKLPNNLILETNKLEDLRILDPACGSGNFLVYTFSRLVDLYKEAYPNYNIIEIIQNILEKNLYGIDINRRPAQLAALALYILAKKTIKENAPELYYNFRMPNINIICSDFKLPKGKYRQKILNSIISEQKPLIEDILSLFNYSNELGSLIDVEALQKELNKINRKIQSKEKGSLVKYGVVNGEKEYTNIAEFINLIIEENKQNIGLQLFGKETKRSLNMAQILLQKYDFIFGNPPFGLKIKKIENQLKKYYPNSYYDLIAMFIDQGLRLLKENG
ncbi:MAG: DNA methyltransferase, partial [Promethearchaeota archaeon]